MAAPRWETQLVTAAFVATLGTANDGTSQFTLVQGVEISDRTYRVEIDVARGKARAVQAGSYCVGIISGNIAV
jgi:hypothetical protein